MFLNDLQFISMEENQDSKKTRNSFRTFFSSIFKPGIVSQITIKKMQLSEIPTQATRINVHIKQGRTTMNSSQVAIVDNKAKWDEEINLIWKMPHKSHSRRPFLLRFSIRLEDNSGRGYSTYGDSLLDLTTIQDFNDLDFSSKLQNCDYESLFHCLISFKLIKEVNLESSNHKVNGLNDNDLVARANSQMPYRFTSKGRFHTLVRDTQYHRMNENKTPLLSSFPKNETRMLHEEDAHYFSLYEELNYTKELPFKVTEKKILLLSQQVDDIIGQVLYDQNE
ncbi:hypothetical protein TRFO_15039 [Tritrichomonas foetus]|uniref:C2 NT-type domain-containing protein n=1 Tax=Tritrichomonas foetus TaxID=1144522 RepID=A0A1J4KY95_9EUKA|nr:hypothetical protein TRFO_15039 [Tritrichomonas foetus]|eukprot:OHT14525.1 hypothetical protein TRFO_15039 [Tritrichomonas foetus]